MAFLWILNLADGRHTLLDIAERAQLPFAVVAEAARLLRDSDLLVEDHAAGRPQVLEELHDRGARPPRAPLVGPVAVGTTPPVRAASDPVVPQPS
jgi:hypothetical protein